MTGRAGGTVVASHSSSSGEGSVQGTFRELCREALPCYRRGNGGTDGLSHWPGVTQPAPESRELNATCLMPTTVFLASVSVHLFIQHPSVAAACAALFQTLRTQQRTEGRRSPPCWSCWEMEGDGGEEREQDDRSEHASVRLPGGQNDAGRGKGRRSGREDAASAGTVRRASPRQ